MPKPWYSITGSAAADTPVEIAIFDEINPWYGVSAKAFITDLKAAISGGATSIKLSINSPGGSVFDGLAIYNALQSCKLPVNVTVMGIAASIASVIAMAGTTIEMPSNAMIMVHNASGGTWGNAEDMRDMADVLDKIDANIVGIYVARTGKPEAEVRTLLANETFLTAQEALDLGFATAITDPVNATAAFDVDKLPDSVKALFKATLPAPVPAPGPTPTPEPDPVPAGLAAEIELEASRAGLSEFVAVWAADAKLTTLASIQAAVTEAKDIQAICALAKRPDDAAGHIRARKPLAEVRASIAQALADEADEARVDTTQSKKPTSAVPSAANFNPSQLWAKVHEMNAAMSGNRSTK